jgi:hypothetical protein
MTDAAAKAGLSVNSWCVRVLARALRSTDDDEPRRQRHRGHREHHGPQGRRLTGWVGPES